MRVLNWLVPAMSVLVVSSVAAAQSRDPAGADELYKQAREALKRGDFAAACPKFAESQRLDPAPSTLINLAMCDERRGALATALAHLQEAVDQLPAADERSRGARERLSALQRRVPRLAVRLGTPTDGGTVRRDDVTLGPASLGASLPVDEGEHIITVTAPRRRLVRVAITLREGEAKEVVVDVGEPEDGPPANSPAQRGSDNGERAPRPMRTVGYVLGGVGALSLGGAAYFALSAARHRDAAASVCAGAEATCPPAEIERRDGENRAGATGASRASLALGAGVTLVVAAVIVWAIDPSPPTTARAWAVAPSVGDGAQGMRLGWAW